MDVYVCGNFVCGSMHVACCVRACMHLSRRCLQRLGGILKTKIISKSCTCTWHVLDIWRQALNFCSCNFKVSVHVRDFQILIFTRLPQTFKTAKHLVWPGSQMCQFGSLWSSRYWVDTGQIGRWVYYVSFIELQSFKERRVAAFKKNLVRPSSYYLASLKLPL